MSDPAQPAKEGLYVVYHMSWERKLFSYSSLIFDGQFETWDKAIRAVFINELNGDIDTGLLEPEPREEYKSVIPVERERIANALHEVAKEVVTIDEYNHGTTAVIWSGEKLYHVRKVA